MVTTNSGSARLVMAPRLNTGAVNTGTAKSSVTRDQAMPPVAAAYATATASVATTA